MYESRPALNDTAELNQGDLLRGFLRPQIPTDKNFGLLRNKNKFDWPARPEHLASDEKDLRNVAPLAREQLVLVVSNSCDIFSKNYPILIVPARPSKFQSETKSDQWEEISVAATGTADAKTFYLPGSPAFEVSRSEAQFNLMFPVSHGYFERCLSEAGATRLCGLTADAQRHLQWALGLFFGRNPREDLDWPSREDLELKVEWLNEKIAKGGKNRDRHKADLEATMLRLRQSESE